MARRSLWSSNIYGSRQFWYSMPGWKSWKFSENPIVHPLCLRIVCEILWHDLNQLGWVTWEDWGPAWARRESDAKYQREVGSYVSKCPKNHRKRSIMDSYGPITSLSVGFFSIPSNFFNLLRCFREVQWLHFEDENQGLDVLKGWWFVLEKNRFQFFQRIFSARVVWR